ncbi:MAG: hypothetical protein VKN33_09200 [Candidatus Sericytochromatia bacterium]|nr:hypothetical protein [Candidatus Sericytochromatia bacterium]
MSGALWGAASVFFLAGRADAAGPLTHLVAAERAFAQLVTSQPGLAPHRDTFYWGAIFPGWDQASGSPHIHPIRQDKRKEFNALWGEARSKATLLQAFALGWQLHLAIEEQQDGWLLENERGKRLAAMIKLPSDRGNLRAAADLALDGALLPGASSTLRLMAIVARAHGPTPVGGSVSQLLETVLGLQERDYLNWAGFVFVAGAQGADSYLNVRARQAHLETILPVLLGSSGRDWVGGPLHFITNSTDAGVAACRALLTGAKRD